MKSNLWFLAAIAVISTISSSVLFADQGGGSGPGNSGQPKMSYGVLKDSSGEHLVNCYRLDANGNPTDQVDDSHCHASYAVARIFCGELEPHYCVNADVNGVAYGNKVDDSLCRVGYGFGSQEIPEDAGCMVSNEGPACFSKDANGMLFGDPVDPSLCKSK